MQLQAFDGTRPEATGPQESIIKPYHGSEGNLTFCYVTKMNNKCKVARVHQKAKYKKGLGGSRLLRGKVGPFCKVPLCQCGLPLSGEKRYSGIFIQRQARTRTPSATRPKATVRCPTQKERECPLASMQSTTLVIHQ